MKTRQMGGESVQERAQRLARVALAGWKAWRGVAVAESDLIAFYVAGFLACADDAINPQPPGVP